MSATHQNDRFYISPIDLEAARFTRGSFTNESTPDNSILIGENCLQKYYCDTIEEGIESIEKLLNLASILP